ncbi:response regulator [Algoriphagus sp.]|uniref:response regulator n=1 Tax=Algoriphagus sp. TaxID=1872435 RepID=UPI00391CA378
MNPEIILVDDDEVLLAILEKMFHKVSPETKLRPFSSGRHALDHLAKFPDSSQRRFLIVDINLKDLTGWDFLNELIERKDSFSKVFLITSSVSSANSEIAKKYPSVIGFYEKPITFEKIEKILNQIKED